MQRDRLTESAIFPGSRGLLAGVVLLLIMGAGAGAVRGAAGDFDPQFSGEGWTGRLAAVGGAMDMAVQPDGKIVVAGTATLDLGGLPGLSVWRFTPDGVPDVSFNGTGQARIEDSRAVGRRVMLRPDGRILIAGTLKAWDDPAPQYILAAFLADGQHELSFGGGSGFTLTSNFNLPNASTLLPDGTILAGTGGLNPPSLKRWLPNGAPDAAFGSSGTAVVPAGIPAASDFAVQSDGRMVMAGQGSPFTVARLLPDGTPDTAFGTGGAVSPGGLGNRAQCRRVRVLPDGKILAAGQGGDGTGKLGATVARFLPDGTPDAAFGSAAAPGAPVFSGVSYTYEFVDLVVQCDGRFIVVGNTGPGIMLMRFTADGAPDTSFGTGGRVNYRGGLESASAAALQPDGKLVVAGLTYANEARLLLARFLTLAGTAGMAVENDSGAAVPPGGALDFGPVPAGTLFMELTLRNTGYTTLTSLQATLLDESHPGDYRVIAPGPTLAPGATAPLLISLKPTAAAGVRSTATLRLTSINPCQALAPVDLPLRGSKATALEVWRHTWFGSTANAGAGSDAGDFDGDGIPNFMEYVTASHPHQASPSPLRPSLQMPGAFTYTRPTAALTEFLCEPESAPSPAGPWSAQGLISTVLTDDGGIQNVQVAPAAGTPAAPQMFFRLRVTKR